MNKFLTLAGILIVALVLVFAFTAQADSELKWSNPDSANGTLILSGVVVSNAMILGAITNNGLTTVSTSWTNANGVAAVSNVFVRAGGNVIVGAGGTITVPAGSIASASLAGNKFTGVITNGIGAASTSYLWIVNGVVTNALIQP